ncbi:MAG: ABC transporter ATP-binding protein [Clostridia bacterium]|nr:ABC transporter ATP-binding protein [Clostridia bacterium]
MIEICNLTKSYGNKKAVDDITFTVEKGEILGFLGPNGAGKSTTMNILTGYISSTSGSVKVDGFDILEEPNEVKKRIGYLPEQPPLYMDMVVSDYLNFVYDLKKLNKAEKLKHIQDIVDIVGIDDVKSRKIGNLSKGYKQRVGLAQALLGNPEVLILDEPTVGLDPKQIIEIRNVIKELGKERTIILSSHILPEVSAVCERVIIINKGKLVAEDTPQNLSHRFTQNSKLQIRVMGNQSDIIDVLKTVPGVKSIVVLGQKETDSFDFEIETTVPLDAEFSKQLFMLCAQKQMPILMQKEIAASLEDIFIHLTATDSQIKQEPYAEENENSGGETDDSDI